MTSKQKAKTKIPPSRQKNVQVPKAGLCNGTALRQASRRISQLYDAILAPCGLRSTQWSILTHIARVKRQSIGDIANSLVLDRSALAHNLRPLERDGLIQIEAGDEDKRSRFATLSRKGQAKVAEAIPLWEQAQRRFEAVYKLENARSLRASLKIIASTEFAEAFQQLGSIPGQ